MNPHILAQYKTSRDYPRLVELMKQQSIICIVDSYGDCHDICRTLYLPSRSGMFDVSSRGHGYITAFSEDDFLNRCAALNLEFIEPEPYQDNQCPAEKSERPGYAALWLWFDLSRAGWLTIPRVLLHEMPDEWQGKLAALLKEYEDTFHNWPDGIGTRVQLTDDGKLTSLHNWLNDYRHPAHGRIETLRAENDVEFILPENSDNPVNPV